MQKKISIVVPLYNEEENLNLLYKEVSEVLKKTNYDFDFIFVNDGSTDKTWGGISELAAKNQNIKGINFSRNFGHPAALQAGLETADGDAIIMMDGDLQHPPKVILEMIEKWEEGYDIVNSVRESTENVSFFKKITAKLFYKLLNSISDLTLNQGEADFRLLDRKAVDVINDLPESPKFYRGLVNWVGFKVSHVRYKAGARIHGNSSFSLKKMTELARMGLTSFSMKPLKIIITIGVSLSSISFLALLVMIYFKFFVNYSYFSNNIVLLTFLIFVTGLLSTFQGIVAIYLVDIFNATKGRPPYIVSEKVNLK